MKDYSSMSDFEINKLVAKLMGHQCYYDNNSYTNDGLNVTVTGNGWRGWYNPTRDIDAAWRIIVANKINIDHRESIKSGAMASQSGRKEIYAVDKNPLRAAMIVFLMMKDEAVKTQGEKS